MFRQRFEEACLWLAGQRENLEQNERQYKVQGAEQVRALLQKVLDGDAEGKINVQPPKALNLLGWQVLDGLNVMVNARPEVFRDALSKLWSAPLSASNADVFWSILDPALDELSPVQRGKFGGEGTRASVASYFLFVADPVRQPFYRPHFGGRAITWLYGNDRLDGRSLGHLLTDYIGRCTYLQREFKDAGLPLEDMIDTQSALYILVDQYLKVARPKRNG